MDEVNKQTKTKTVDIFPLGKGRRILTYLCDYVICLFTTFFLFNVMIYPISKAIGGYHDKYQEKGVCEKAKLDILYEYDLLFYKEDASKYEFENNKAYTFDQFLMSWVLGDEMAGVNRYDVVKNYWIDIKNNPNEYARNYYDSELTDTFFFEYDENHFPIALKDQFKNDFRPYFVEGDEMSEAAKHNLEVFKNNFFISAYSSIFADIQYGNEALHVPASDLWSKDGTKSFNNLTNRVLEITKFQNITYISSTIASYVLAWLILFFIIPFFTKNHKTISMMFMKTETIKKETLFLMKKRDVILLSLYNLIANLHCLWLIPLAVVNFNYVFSLTPLLVVSLISFVYVIFSFIVLLFNAFNRTINDLLTQTLMISTDTLDEIYREKGYDI